jgi:exopolyphosphatase/guanosine-5'-triphosphate,3'-diphosphate pyrophosphatase
VSTRKVSQRRALVRLGILDVGSNTVHLLVVDAEPGSRPVPAADPSWDSPLLRQIDGDHSVSDEGLQELVSVIDEAHDYAKQLGVTDFSAFATSAFRDAPNADELLEIVRHRTGVDLHVLDGDDEARLTFLAARRWFGWGSGRLLLIDIGGGSLELAAGADESPEHVASLPLGAARLTRDLLPDDPPRDEDVKALQVHVRATIAATLRPFRTEASDVAVGTSKTLRSLARVAGAAPSAEGPYVRRILRADDAERLVDKLAGLPTKERAKLPGVSSRRARQLLAGAIVASTTMSLLDIDEVNICPWALREGVILARQDWMTVW